MNFNLKKDKGKLKFQVILRQALLRNNKKSTLNKETSKVKLKSTKK